PRRRRPRARDRALRLVRGGGVVQRRHPARAGLVLRRRSAAGRARGRRAAVAVPGGDAVIGIPLRLVPRVPCALAQACVLPGAYPAVWLDALCASGAALDELAIYLLPGPGGAAAALVIGLPEAVVPPRGLPMAC